MDSCALDDDLGEGTFPMMTIAGMALQNDARKIRTSLKTEGNQMTRRLQILGAAGALLVVFAAPAWASHTGGPMMVGDAITEEFALDPDEVHDLHEMGIGYGGIFKLEIYAIALGVEVETLLATFEVDPETGEYEFAWGELKKTLDEDQLAILEGLPKNLGRVVSQANKPDHAGNGKPDHAGNGKPDWAGEGKPPHAGGGDD